MTPACVACARAESAIMRPVLLIVVLWLMAAGDRAAALDITPDLVRDLRLRAPQGSVQIPFAPQTDGFIDGGTGEVELDMAGLQARGGHLAFRLLRQDGMPTIVEEARFTARPDHRLTLDTRTGLLPGLTIRALCTPRVITWQLVSSSPQALHVVVTMSDIGSFSGTLRDQHDDWVPFEGHAGMLSARMVIPVVGQRLGTPRLQSLQLSGDESAQAAIHLYDRRHPIAVMATTLDGRCDDLGRLLHIQASQDGTVTSPGGEDSPPWILHAPSPAWSDGIITARAGFVLRSDERLLMGDALRWDQREQELFARGRILFVQPGLRLEADRLGSRANTDQAPSRGDERPPLDRGDAWQVRSVLLDSRRQLRLRSDRVAFTPERVDFLGVRGDGGHGSLFAAEARRITAYLRPEPVDRPGIKRDISGILAVHPRIRVGGVPVLYVPVLYRDFVIDYPWTHYRYIRKSRQGHSLEARIRLGAPPVAGWHPHVEGLLDLHEYNDRGVGGRLVWRHPQHGRGEALYYTMAEERVRRTSGGAAIDHRHAAVVDLEQQLSFPGGGIYGRWTKVPDADAGLPFDERFRHDFLRDDFEQRPLARRGVSTAFSLPFATLSADISRRHHDDLRESDREHAVGLVIPGLRLLGPLHVEAEAQHEQLRHEFRDDRALRQRYRAAASIGHWFSWGGGLDLEAGIRGLQYRRLSLADVVQDDAHALVPYGNAEAQLRLEGLFAGNWRHVITPRIGYHLIGVASGDDLPATAFDDRDRLDADLRLLIAGLRSTLSRQRVLMTLDAESRWLLRDEIFGTDELQRGELLDARLRLSGSPLRFLSLTADARWDGIEDRWSRFDAQARLNIVDRVILRDTATWRVEDERWEHHPGVEIIGNRYALDVGLRLNDTTDHRIDQWEATLSRRMVDGTIGLGYEMSYDEDLERQHRVQFTISFAMWGPR